MIDVSKPGTKTATLRGRLPVIIANKVRRPSGTNKVILRSRLFDRIDADDAPQIVIVKAAAGYGKSTLLKQIDQERANSGETIAWLRLDSADNEVSRALSYLVAAFAEIDNETKSAMVPITSAIPPHPVEDIIASLIEQIDKIRSPITLIIDDYNTIKNQQVHKAIYYFLCHMPARVRCVIATRSLPAWNFQDLNQHTTVITLEEPEIRFTQQETDEYLKSCHNIELHPEGIREFHLQTDGWVTAIQLASHSLADKLSPSIHERVISGSHTELVNYLAEAVISGISDEARLFLLQTSILDRFCPALCDAITGDQNAKAIIEQLLRENLFVEPLDTKGEWFRYHVLFTEFLQDRAQKSPDIDLSKLHRKASIWLEINRQPHAAAEHAMAAGDETRRNDLIEDAILELVRGSQIGQAIGWFESLPSSFSKHKPDVLIPMSWTYAYCRRLDQAEALLACVRNTLEDHPDKLTARDLERREEYLTEVEIAELDLFRAHSNKNLDLKVLRAIKDRLRPNWHFLRAYTELMISRASIEFDELDAAFAAAADAVIFAQKVPNPFVANLSTEQLVQIRYWQGRLDEAWAFCGQAIDQARDAMGNPLPVAGHFNLLAAFIHYEQNNLDKSRQFLQEALRLTSLNESPNVLAETEVLAAQLVAVEHGEDAGAKRLFEFNNSQLSKSDRPFIDRVRSMQVWFLTGCREFGAAQEVLETLGVSVNKVSPPANLTLTPSSEITYFAMCRLMIATGKADHAINWLRHLLRLAQRSGRVRSCVQIFGLLALAQDARNRPVDALRYVREMVNYASQDKFARSIVDLGPEMIRLISEYRKHLESAPDTPERNAALQIVDHLAGVARGGETPIAAPAAQSSPVSRHEPRQEGARYNRLTNRELQVLELIARGKTNREVATDLLIAESSVRWHVRNLFTKLDVHNRTEASAKGRALKLIQ